MAHAVEKVIKGNVIKVIKKSFTLLVFSVAKHFLREKKNKTKYRIKNMSAVNSSITFNVSVISAPYHLSNFLNHLRAWI